MYGCQGGSNLHCILVFHPLPLPFPFLLYPYFPFLDPYLLLVVESCEERHAKLKNNLAKIQKLVRKLPTMNRENIRKIEQKLELCRNQSKNPASDEWKKKMQVG